MNRPTDDRDDATGYEIRLAGHLDRRWLARFDGLSMRLEGDGTTVIGGPVPDQAALHGLLRQIRDLGLPLLSVTRLEPGQPDPPGSTWAPPRTTNEGRTTR